MQVDLNSLKYKSKSNYKIIWEAVKKPQDKR